MQKLRKNRHLGTIAQLCWAMSLQLKHISTIGKNMFNSNTFSTFSHNMVNFGPLTAEIVWRVWGTPRNFNGFRVLASLFFGFDQQHSTEGATYIRLGGYHVGHLVIIIIFALRCILLLWGGHITG